MRAADVARRGLPWLSLAVFGALAVFCFIGWRQAGRAYFFPDAPAGQFACLSYTPRAGTAGGEAPDTHAQIERDLQQLAQSTRCVRTYAVSNGLDYVPVAARRFGLRVVMGLWIGSNATVNEQEITHGIEVARANMDVIDAIVVGNEVLLRREQDAAALAQMLTRVHDATGLPVTYADVWDFWLKNPQLASAASFVTIHILPYWEDDPIGIDQGLQHVVSIYDKVQKVFPDKRIFLGETGWPSLGRQREAAEPSLLNQARFTREFIAYAAARDWPYNFIEAYDQPWKRRLEGTAGGYWGLYDAAGDEKFPLVGPVIRDPKWWRGPAAGVATGLIFLIIAAVRTRDARSVLLWLFAGFSAGALLTWQWDYLWASNRTPLEWAGTAAWSLFALAVFVFALVQLTQTLPTLSGGAQLRNDTPSRRASGAAAWISRWIVLAFLFGVAYIDLGLTFDARYRGFPSVFVILPTLTLALNSIAALAARKTLVAFSVEESVLAWGALISVPWIAWNEGAKNLSALNWCLWSALLALSILAFLYVQAREQQSAAEQAHGR